MTRTEKILFATAVLFAVLKTSVLIWAANFGLDSTDESFLLNGYRYWQLYNTFDYFKVFNLFTNTAELSVANFRLLKIVIEIFSALIFAGSFYRWYNFYAHIEDRATAPVWLVFFCVAIALGQSVIFRLLSYNEIVYMLMCVSWSALLLAEIQAKNIFSVLAYTLTGLLTSVMFFVKPPAAVLEVVLLCCYVVSRVIQQKKFYMGRMVGLVVGAGVFLALYPGLGKNFSNWLQNFISLVAVYRNLEYTTDFILFTALGEMFNYVLFFTIATVPVWLLNKLTTRVAESFKRWSLFLFLHIALVVVSAWLAEVVLNAHSYHRFLHYSILIFMVLVYHLAAIRFSGFRGLWQSAKKFMIQHKLRMLLLFLFLHFVVVGGSTASLSEMFYIFLTPALLVLFVPTYTTAQAVQLIRYQTLAGTLLILMTFNFFYFNMAHAYGLAKGLWEQNRQVNLSENILVDADTQMMFEKLNSCLVKGGFRKGNPIISLDYLCGIAHLAGGYSPGCPCYVPGNENKMNFNCHYLHSIPESAIPDTVAVLFTNYQSQKLVSCVPANGREYSFTITDSVFNAYTLNSETKEMMGEKPEYIKIGWLTFVK